MSYTFWQRFFSSRSLGQQLLTFWDSLSPKPNAFFRVENRAFPDEGFDTASSTVDLIQSHLAYDLGAVDFSQFLDLLNLAWELLGE